ASGARDIRRGTPPPGGRPVGVVLGAAAAYLTGTIVVPVAGGALRAPTRDAFSGHALEVGFVTLAFSVLALVVSGLIKVSLRMRLTLRRRAPTPARHRPSPRAAPRRLPLAPSP